MTTECNQHSFEFHSLNQRKVVARFDGGNITSDAGILLLREVEKRSGLIAGLAQCFRDYRDQRWVEQLIEFLQDAARKYFGSDSPMRDEFLPGIMERKALQKEAADKARARRRKGMRQFLREQSGPLEDAIRSADALLALAKDTLSERDRVQATVLAARTAQMRSLGDHFARPPHHPGWAISKINGAAIEITMRD